MKTITLLALIIAIAAWTDARLEINRLRLRVAKIEATRANDETADELRKLRDDIRRKEVRDALLRNREALKDAPVIADPASAFGPKKD